MRARDTLVGGSRVVRRTTRLGIIKGAHRRLGKHPATAIQIGLTTVAVVKGQYPHRIDETGCVR